jgi:DNA phosphorothioation-associated putative methyltransferase
MMHSALQEIRVERHRTAMKRVDVSRPVRLALEDGLMVPGMTVFDYGCGHGGDIRRLLSLGIWCEGWDPAFHPHMERSPAEVVNLGYVVNVIEDPKERIETLRLAWSLATRVLVVSARLTSEMADGRWVPCGDGFVTGRDTFQKLYEQQELREWIDAALGTPSVPAAPGVFYIFRDPELAQTYLASRFRRRIRPRQIRINRGAQLFEEHRELLDPLMAFFADRGRLPEEGELEVGAELREQFGSLKRAFGVVQVATGTDQWKQVARERSQDLLVYLALARFGGRPSLRDLPEALRLDIRALCVSYRKACDAADDLLFSVGKQDVVSCACAESVIGKCTQEALYLHVDALPHAPALLRVYEGCARAYVGSVDGGNLLKLHRRKPQVSYLAYPDFETDPHPRLRESLKVRFKGLQIEYRDYRDSPNPFILHRKETFVAPDHPRRTKFEKLTRQEEARGLFERTQMIGTEQGWSALLRERGLTLRGHQLVRALTS